jgi:ubiquitin
MAKEVVEVSAAEIAGIIAGEPVIVKAASGAWFLQFYLNGEIQLDDDRSVIVERKISVRVAQKGRKPRTVRANAVKGEKGFQK